MSPATSAIPEAVGQAVERAAESGELRIAVSCAGIGWAQRTVGRQGEPHDLEAFKTVVNVNLIGTFNVMRLAAGAIARTEPGEDGERGVVVNTASIAAYEGQIGQISYSASKGGVVGMTVPAARDLSASGHQGEHDRSGLDGHAASRPPAGGAAGRPRSRRPVPEAPRVPGRVRPAGVTIVENPYLNGETIRLDGGLRMPPK